MQMHGAVQVSHLGLPDTVRRCGTRSTGRAWQACPDWLHFGTLPENLHPIWLPEPHSGSTPALVSPCWIWAGLVYIMLFSAHSTHNPSTYIQIQAAHNACPILSYLQKFLVCDFRGYCLKSKYLISLK